jgi:hypothetical protein
MLSMGIGELPIAKDSRAIGNSLGQAFGKSASSLLAGKSHTMTQRFSLGVFVSLCALCVISGRTENHFLHNGNLESVGVNGEIVNQTTSGGVFQIRYRWLINC